MAQVSQNLIGKRLKEARGKTRPATTQAQLSKALAKHGVSIDRAGIAKIETGIRGVLDFEVVALAKCLHVTTSWLLGQME